MADRHQQRVAGDFRLQAAALTLCGPIHGRVLTIDQVPNNASAHQDRQLGKDSVFGAGHTQGAITTLSRPADRVPNVRFGPLGAIWN